MPAHALDVHAVHEYASAVDLVISHEQLDEGGFARSCRSDNGYALSGSRLEGEVLDDRLSRNVPELHVFKGNIAVDVRGEVVLQGVFPYHLLNGILHIAQSGSPQTLVSAQRLHVLCDMGCDRHRFLVGSVRRLFLLFIQELEYPLRRGCRGLELVGYVCHMLHRLVE